MAYTTYNCDTLTGGAARSLDLLAVGDLTTGDRAVVMTTAASYFFKYNSTGTAAEQVATAPRVVRPDDYSTGGNWEEYVAASTAAASVLAQAKSAVVNAVVTGSPIMPLDDTIPQNTEGFEVITCAITPKSASNLLVIIANVPMGHYVTEQNGGMALFQDTTAGALAAVPASPRAYGSMTNTLIHKMTAGTVSETTFKIRVGPATSGTWYVNSVPGATGRVFGGVCSTTLTILEYTP
jgi:hypothetical protein